MSDDIGITVRGLDTVAQSLDALPEKIRKARGEMLDRLGRQLLADVQKGIGGSGHLASLQEYRVGSGRGYVAIRPQTGMMDDGYAIGYVTAALEHGHRQQIGRYIPALGASLIESRVEGKFAYYAVGKTQAARVADELIAFDRQISKILEGQGE